MDVRHAITGGLCQSAVLPQPRPGMVIADAGNVTETAMRLFHTSPTEIGKIDGSGPFGSFLFFSTHVRETVPRDTLVYSLDIDESSLLDACQISCAGDTEKIQPIIDEIARKVGVDNETAFALICQRENVFDLDGIDRPRASELGFDIQYATARAACALGYRGAAMKDKQGTAYMVDMLGRETELVRH
jgi:hypothetical protein